MDVELEKKNQANLFQGNQLVAEGMTLQFIAPIVKNGETVVELCKVEVESEIEKQKHA